jgi:hypothetical protein
MGGKSMIGTFDYRERINECQQWAEKAANDQAKGLWKEMERFWRGRATLANHGSATSSEPPPRSSRSTAS